MVMLAGVGALMALLYVVLAVVVAHLFTTPRRIRSRVHDGADYERVQFCARGESLQLIASYRRTAGATGAVILAHGRDSCRGEELRGTTRTLVHELTSRGLSVIMVDLRGHGESDRARLTFGRRERYDILGAVDFLLDRGYEPGRIGVLGASMGGVSAIAAAAEEHAIGALITDSAFASLEEVLTAQFTRLTRLPSFVLRGALVAGRALTGENLLRHAPAENMRRLRGRPTLVIHAEFDPFVPVQHARVLAIAGDCESWITGGSRHLSSFGATGPAYLDLVGVFFARHLGVRAPLAPEAPLMADVA
jgi:pimeloyl-ACP methyl ester carboxylesterase